MKKRLPATLVIAVSLIALAPSVFARTPGRGHELRLGLGGYPSGAGISKGFMFGKVGYDYYSDYYYPEYYGQSNVDRFHDYKGREVSLGTLTLQYSFNFNEKRAIAANFGYDQIFGSLYDGYTQERKGGQHSFGFSFYPEYRRTWNPENFIKVYTSISAGFGIGVYHNTGSDMFRYYDSETGTYSDEKAWSTIPILQVTPVGLSFGKKWFGFSELTLGTLMFGIRAGVGYKF